MLIGSQPSRRVGGLNRQIDAKEPAVWAYPGLVDRLALSIT